MAKPDRKCFGRGVCMHIGTAVDFWADDGMCLKNPVDAASYPGGTRIYAGANTNRSWNSQFKIYCDGIFDQTISIGRGGDYCWMWWEWPGWNGTLRIDYCNGDSVIYSRSTVLGVIKQCDEGEKRTPSTCWDKSTINAEVCKSGVWTLSGETCPIMPAPGEKRTPSTCWDGSVIHAEIFDATLMQWLPTGETCPVIPDPGEKRKFTCWDGSVIYDAIFDATLKQWLPTGETCPIMPAPGEKRTPSTCWDLSVIHAEIFDATLKQWLPTGETCPVMPAHGEKRTPYTCWDESVIHEEIFDATRKQWLMTGETCPVIPAHGEKRKPSTCWDESVIHEEIFDATLMQWLPTGETCPSAPPEGTKRGEAVCKDGSTIYQEVFAGDAWIPSGEKCPEELPKRTIMAAVPKIMYEGQKVNIVVGAYLGAAPSTDETAILTIDNTEVSRMNTKAGEVTFKWTAEGVGMHNLCITIPANVNLPTPGRICETIMVSADVGSVKEQVKSEMDAYNEALKMLRKKKQLVREELRGYVRPGRISFPASLVGSIIEIGGVPITVPPGGTTIPIPAGDHQVITIIDGIEEIIRVIVLPGEEVFLL